jgi:hypothetical protein
MNLISKQKLFSRLIAKLIIRAYELGHEVTLGEAWRPPETAKLYALDGRGVENSLHPLRLAMDINLFKDGVFLRNNADYEQLGLYWESLSTSEYTCTWGGRFGDGNHFSIEHGGAK